MTITDGDSLIEMDPNVSPQLLLSRTATKYVALDPDVSSVMLEAGGPVLVLDDDENAALLEQRVPYLLPKNRKARLHVVDTARVTLAYTQEMRNLDDLTAADEDSEVREGDESGLHSVG